jgi:DNA-binding IclR family transcriptional regulator
MLRKAMEVLELFHGERRELGVLEVANLLGRPKSTTSRWLSEMETAGFLERDGASGRYRISMRLAALGEAARQSTSVQRLARPELQVLSAATGETANLVVLSGREAVNIEMVESLRPVKHVGWVGRRMPLHATAAGKALLAWLPQRQIKSLIKAPLAAHARNTITTVAQYMRELEVVRARGYSTSVSELEDDLSAVAAPVFDHAGGVAGAITISAPISRVPKNALAGLAPAVLSAARAVSAALGYRG